MYEINEDENGTTRGSRERNGWKRLERRKEREERKGREGGREGGKEGGTRPFANSSKGFRGTERGQVASLGPGESLPNLTSPNIHSFLHLLFSSLCLTLSFPLLYSLLYMS